jgi:hypothetical protein
MTLEKRDAATTAPMSHVELERFRIRELLENWVVSRDSGDWERFATLWHDEGRMNATWFRATASEYIDGCRKGFEAGMIGAHSLGASNIDVDDKRAVAQTRMHFTPRGVLHGVEVDLVCCGRFVDAIEKRADKWGIVLRQLVFDFDRICPVDPSASLSLDRAVLERFPVGYRHLAYFQTERGYKVSTAIPGTHGSEIEALRLRMARWLAGADAACL